MPDKVAEKRKRIKLQGGSVKWTQTRFHPYAESIRQFEEQIWQFYSKSKKADDANMFGRLKVEIHWEPKETAEQYNAQQEAKERHAKL